MSRPDSILAQLRPAGGWYATTRPAGPEAPSPPDVDRQAVDKAAALGIDERHAGDELPADDATAPPAEDTPTFDPPADDEAATHAMSDGLADDKLATATKLPTVADAATVLDGAAGGALVTTAPDGPVADVDEPRRPMAVVRAPAALPTSRKPGPGSWIEAGACAGLDPALFFPERGESTAEAKAVCAGCTVRDECLDYAVTRPEKAGVWGGTSERERRRIRRERLAAARAREAS